MIESTLPDTVTPVPMADLSAEGWVKAVNATRTTVSRDEGEWRVTHTMSSVTWSTNTCGKQVLGKKNFFSYLKNVIARKNKTILCIVFTMITSNKG